MQNQITNPLDVECYYEHIGQNDLLAYTEEDQNFYLQKGEILYFLSRSQECFEPTFNQRYIEYQILSPTYGRIHLRLTHMGHCLAKDLFERL